MLKNDLNAFMDIRLENSCTKGKRETIIKKIDKYEFTCISIRTMRTIHTVQTIEIALTDLFILGLQHGAPDPGSVAEKDGIIIVNF